MSKSISFLKKLPKANLWRGIAIEITSMTLVARKMATGTQGGGNQRSRSLTTCNGQMSDPIACREVQLTQFCVRTGAAKSPRAGLRYSTCLLDKP
jgi:hypothetical protein